MSQVSPSRHQEKIIVRLPDGMRDRLAEAAKANKRSVNAEVVERLERSFMILGVQREPTHSEILDAIRRLVAEDAKS